MKMEAITLQTLSLAAALWFLASAPAISQVTVLPPANPTVVPQMTRYAGVAPNRAAGAVEMLFRIYPVAEGGEPLWTETQQVAVGADGKYTVLLGAAAEGGLPQAVFADGQARWLGVTVAGAPEQRRIALDSAAYAMKAADAETLGGVPAAEFVTRAQFLAHPQPLLAGAMTPASASGKSAGKARPNDTPPTGSGTANTIAMWTDSGTLGNSLLTQSGTNISASGSLSGYTNSSLDNAAGVYGFQTGSTGRNFGVQGSNSSSMGDAGGSPAGVDGWESSTTGVVFGVAGSTNSVTNGAAGINGYEGASTGQVFGVSGGTASSTTYASGVNGNEGAATGLVFGVNGGASSSTSGAAGVSGHESAATGQVYGVVGSTSSTGGIGVAGNEWANTGLVAGVSGFAQSSTYNSAAVSGWENATTGEVWGVSGATMATGFQDPTLGWQGSAGVNGWQGNATARSVAGVRGSALSTGAGAAGVYGWEYAKTGQVYGVSGQSDSAGSGAAGVFGSETAASGATVGVSGLSASTAGVGVLGTASAAGATAGQFVNAAGSGLILNGLSGANFTQVFSVDASGNGAFAGNLAVAGSLSGKGLISGVTATSPLTGGGTSGAVTVGLNTTALETTLNGVYAQLGGANTFAKPITFAIGQKFPGMGTISGVAVSSPLTGGGASGAVTVGLSQTALQTTLDGVYARLGAANTFAKPITFATGQKFPGVGTISAVTVSSPLTGGGASGAVTVGLNKAALETTLNSVYPQLAAANHFVGNQTVAGNLTVTGKLVKGSGSFKIDHPLDPANKTLSHSFVESPDMMNVYNGNIVTDRHGVATVVLPAYFEALNRDFRYQLTVIGKFAQAIVAEKVAGNRFVIRTSKPGVEVSWQITGIRQDAYANSDRIPVEEEKPAAERGFYLHPEAFGQPGSRSVVAAGQPGSASGPSQSNSR